MKINPSLCMTKQQKIVPCTCTVTGINSALTVPAIAGYAFEYVHPLGYFSNCIGMIKQGSKYLRELDQQILAGLIISSYTHFSLIDILELSAQEANAILCTASQASLIEALELVPLFTQQNVVASPVLILNWSDLKDKVDVNQELTTYIRRLAKDFKTPAASVEERKQMHITVLNREAIERRMRGGYIALDSSKHVLSDSERDFEEDFRNWKKEAKRLLSALSQAAIISPEFIAFLKTVTKDRNLVNMGKSLRDKVAQKLLDKTHPDADRLAKIIQDCEPVEAAKELPAVSIFTSPEKKAVRSLRDILADKKRKSQIMATTIEAVENLHEAMQAEHIESVEEFDARIDEEEEDDDLLEPVELDITLNKLNAPRSFGEDF